MRVVSLHLVVVLDAAEEGPAALPLRVSVQHTAAPAPAPVEALEWYTAAPGSGIRIA